MALVDNGAHWQRVNDWLRAHRELWQPTPFTQPVPGWARRWPALERTVAGFSDDQVEYFDQHPVALAQALAPLLSSLAELERLTAVPRLVDGVAAEACTLPEVRARDMPGRKRLQSGAFAAAVRPMTAPVFDWCCGKGHLARTLLPYCAHPVTGYEWNPALVDQGNRLAGKAGDAVRVLCQDVMATDLRLPEGAHGVALHACGDLHRRLIQQSAQTRLPRVSLAPCCFHRSAQSRYQPLSDLARQAPSRLTVTTADLKLAVEETVTAPARVRQQLQSFSQWRLGFDGLQRQLRGVDDYLPVPTHPNWVAKGDFEQFCRWAADRKQLTLPGGTDYGAWQAYGVARLARVRRYELVRHLFRRPLELWLVLDYAIYLEEQGYRVRLGSFCERALTPRNLLIDAVLAG